MQERQTRGNTWVGTESKSRAKDFPSFPDAGSTLEANSTEIFWINTRSQIICLLCSINLLEEYNALIKVTGLILLKITVWKVL